LWLTAPAGAGKTCAVSQYLEHRGKSSLWLDLEQEDSDPASFFHYLARAARVLTRKELPILLPEYRKALVTFSRRFLEELFEHLPSAVTITVDNLERIAPDSPVLDVLCRAILQTPAEAQWILISRHMPPDGLARLRASEALGLVDWEELRFTAAETAAFVQAEGRGLEPDVAREIHRSTEGWPAGLVLSVKAALARLPSGSKPAAGTGEELLFEFFAVEVFRSLTEEERRFLCAIALLPEVSCADAAELTRNERAAELLAGLAQSNQFTALLDAPTGTYRLHPLFRSFLHKEGARQLGSEHVRELSVHAGTLLSLRENHEAAAALFERAGAWAELGALLELTASELLRRGQHQLVEAWARTLGERAARVSPKVTYFRGLSRMPFDAAEAAELLARAHEGFLSEGKDGVFILLSWAGAVEGLLYGSGFAALDRWIDGLPELLERYRPRSLPLKARVAALAHSALICRRPGDPAIEPWERQVRRYLYMARFLDPTSYVLMLHNMFHHHLWLGRVGDAEAAYASVTRVLERRQVDPAAQICYFLMGAVRGAMLGYGVEGVKAAARGLLFAEQTGAHSWDAVLLGQAGLGSLVAGDLAAAETYRDRFAALLRPDRVIEVLAFHDLSAQIALSARKPVEALHHQRVALDAAEEAGHPFCLAAVNVGAGEVELENGNVARAREHFQVALELGERMHSDSVRARAILGLTRVAFGAGEGVGGKALLAAGLKLYREHGYRCSFWWRAGAMRELCARALELDVETGFVSELIRHWAFEPPDESVQSWPWPVRIYTLQQEFLVTRADDPIAFHGKSQRRPLELLQALIAFGGKQVSEGLLSEALWPEADGDAAYRAFSTTLHRLRKLIGAEAIVRTDMKLSINSQFCWVDCFQLERSCDAGNADRSFRDLPLYQRPFLWQLDAAWVFPYREKLANLFVRETLALAASLAFASRIEEAEAVLTRALELDPASRRLQASLRDLYRQSDNPAAAEDAAVRLRNTRALKFG